MSSSSDDSRLMMKGLLLLAMVVLCALSIILFVWVLFESGNLHRIIDTVACWLVDGGVHRQLFIVPCFVVTSCRFALAVMSAATYVGCCCGGGSYCAPRFMEITSFLTEIS